MTKPRPQERQRQYRHCGDWKRIERTIKYDYAAPPPEAALMGDECGCEDCLAAVPGAPVAGNDAAEGRVQALNEISGAQP